MKEDPAIGDDLSSGGCRLCVAERECESCRGVVRGEGDEGRGVIDDGGFTVA